MSKAPTIKPAKEGRILFVGSRPHTTLFYLWGSVGAKPASPRDAFL
jgi:hypothetical protein